MNKISETAGSDPIMATDEIRQCLDAIISLSHTIKGLENQKFKLQTKVQAYMREKDLLIDNDGLVIATWKFTKASTRFDAKALEKFEPDTYKKYLEKIEPSRRFLIKDAE